MPYRRLPATDQTRLKALKAAVQCAAEADYTQQVLSYHTLTEAQKLLLRFENMVSQYKQNFDTKVSANKQYRHLTQNARMYISHFIQVLDLAVIRGEIKKEQKALYHLDINSHTLPNLSQDEDILKWGEYIIEGERERTAQGGFPIYNPAINKVKVHFDIFKEHQVTHQMHCKTTNRVTEDMEELRRQTDEVILDIWNQVENYYRDYLPYERLKNCQRYGLIYYYRNGEAQLTEETDRLLRHEQNRQTELQWSPSE